MSGRWQRIQTSLTGGALLIAAASLVSKVLGFVRDRLLAAQFGAGDTLDAYYAAFKLPDLIFNVLVLGALSAAFIPVFIERWQKCQTEEEKQQAWHIANSVLNILLIILAVLSVLLILFAPWLVPFLAPGFPEEKMRLTVQLTQIMLGSILFFGVSNVFSGLLNAFRRFAAYAMAPIFYNVGIIVGITAFYSWWGIPGLAWGVVLGAALHMLVQIPAVFHTGYRYSTALDMRDPAVKKIMRLILPRTLGLAVNQLNNVVITIIGSTLAAGSVAIFNFANNLQSFPIGLVGVSLAVAAFPYFSEAFSQQDKEKFVTHFSITLRRIVFFIVPAAVLILLLRAHIVRVVLGAGEFDWEATYLTAQTLGYFAVSLVAQSLLPMLARSFYADQDTSTPVKIAVVSLLVNVALSIWLAPQHGILGLAAAFSVANVVNMLLLLAVLRVRHGNLDDERIIRSTINILLASAVMALVTWISLRAFLPGINNRTFIGIFLQGAIAGSIGILVYLGIAITFRFDEVHLVTTRLQRIWQQLRAVLRNGGKWKQGAE
ncbi:MAG: murein biosynthesis integral membrane protein MurJ [Candidatus Nomurabacteria bacterium]|nr:MAG: murein biosynthesis integral membrane protein MurJ [Candidatus Nomurabacteria bacterium]